MNFPDQLFPAAFAWGLDAAALLLLGLLVLAVPWVRLRNQATLNLWLGTCVGLMMLWSMHTGIKPGLDFHLIGAMLMTLMFGARFAALGMAIVLLAVTLAGAAGWQAFGLNWLLGGLWPVSLSAAIFYLVDRKLPNHLFVYIFLNGFIGAGLVVVSTGLAVTATLALHQVYASAYLVQNYLPYYLLMGWSEALLTGMAVTLMTVFRPGWLTTFDDVRYLKVKRPRAD